MLDRKAIMNSIQTYVNHPDKDTHQEIMNILHQIEKTAIPEKLLDKDDYIKLLQLLINNYSYKAEFIYLLSILTKKQIYLRPFREMLTEKLRNPDEYFDEKMAIILLKFYLSNWNDRLDTLIYEIPLLLITHNFTDALNLIISHPDFESNKDGLAPELKTKDEAVFSKENKYQLRPDTAFTLNSDDAIIKIQGKNKQT